MIFIVIDNITNKKYFMSEKVYTQFQNFIEKQKEDFLIVEKKLKDKIVK